MKTQRYLLLFMIALELGVFAVTTQSFVSPVMICVFAIIGASSWFSVDVRPEREIIIALILSIFFVLMWRTSPSDHVDGSAFFPLTYILGLSFMSLQVLHMFCRFRVPLSPIVLFYGIIAMACAGNVFMYNDQDVYFQMSVTVYMLLLLFFLINSNGSLFSFKHKKRGLALFFLIGVFVGTAAITGNIMRSNKNNLNKLVSGILIMPFPRSAGGFSSVCTLDTVNNMKFGPDKNKIMLRVFSSETPHYLKGNVYEKYHSSQWTTDLNGRRIVPVTKEPDFLPQTEIKMNLFLARKELKEPFVTTEVWPDPEITRGIYTPPGLLAVRAPVQTMILNGHHLLDSGEIIGGVNYISYSTNIKIKEKLSRHFRKRLLGVPKHIRKVTGKIAADLFKDCKNDKQKIQRLIGYFNKDFAYALGIYVPEKQDPIIYFLTKKKEAHCQYFASAGALIFRSAGMPARYVVGFASKEYNSAGKYWISRKKDAHAWIEVYLPDQGWITVDPTPGGSTTFSPTMLTRLMHLLDVFKFRLQEFQAIVRINGFLGLLQYIFRILRWIWHLAMSYSLTAVIIKVLLLVYLITTLVVKLGNRIRKYRADDYRELHRLLSGVDNALFRHGIERRKHETLHQFAERLRTDHKDRGGERLAAWYTTYADIRYRRMKTEFQM